MNADHLPSAPLWRRLMAMGYDSLLLLAVIMAYGYAYLGIKVLLLGDAYRAHLKSAHAGSDADPLMFMGMLLAIFLFFHLFWRKRGQTLGMQVWRIRIQREDGNPPRAHQTIVRLLVAPLAMGCFGLGYLWCLFGNHNTWQDMASGTRVVLLPGEKK